MTKEKIIEGMRKRSEKIFTGKNGEYTYYCDGCRYFEIYGMELAIQLKENPLYKPVKFFDDATIRDLSNAISIDKKRFNEWFKDRRRNGGARVPMICKYGDRLVAFNPWFMKEQFEFCKDWRIFLSTNKDAWKNSYIAPIYSFSIDFNSIRCVTLPVKIGVESEMFKREGIWMELKEEVI